MGGILDQLGEYARRQGATSETTEFFVPAPHAPNEAAFQAALAKNKGKPADRLLALAITFSVDAEAIRRYPEVVDASFDEATYVAQALVRSGDPERGWQIIASKVPRWSPIDPAQVAPVVMLVDDYLRQIVSPARAAEVVRTPRAVRT